jgi:hypothetical protein
MRKIRLILLGLACLAILAVGLWLGATINRLWRPGQTGFYNTTTVLRQVQTLSQLVTVKYVMEKVVVYEDVKWFPGGDNRVILIAHGIVKAGVDLQRLEAGDIELSGPKLRIKLPSPQITDSYLDDSRTQVFERSTGLLRTFDKDLEQTARAIAVDDIRRAARYAGILKDADERAQTQIRVLFQQAGLEVEFVPR